MFKEFSDSAYSVLDSIATEALEDACDDSASCDTADFDGLTQYEVYEAVGRLFKGAEGRPIFKYTYTEPGQYSNVLFFIGTEEEIVEKLRHLCELHPREDESEETEEEDD